MRTDFRCQHARSVDADTNRAHRLCRFQSCPDLTPSQVSVWCIPNGRKASQETSRSDGVTATRASPAAAVDDVTAGQHRYEMTHRITTQASRPWGQLLAAAPGRRPGRAANVGNIDRLPILEWRVCPTGIAEKDVRALCLMSLALRQNRPARCAARTRWITACRSLMFWLGNGAGRTLIRLSRRVKPYRRCLSQPLTNAKSVRCCRSDRVTLSVFGC